MSDSKPLSSDLDDELDGLCDESIQPEPIADEDLDGIVLFADLAGEGLEAIEARKREYDELFGEYH